MATSQISDVVAHLRRAVLLGGKAGLTDEQLLQGFVAQREEAAFAALRRALGLLHSPSKNQSAL